MPRILLCGEEEKKLLQNLKGIMRLCMTRRVVFNSIKIAAVVGTALNLINQGERLLDAERISWGHFALNYAVPFMVASYSAGKNELQRMKV